MMKLGKIVVIVVIGMSSLFVTNPVFANYIWSYTAGGATCPQTGCVESDTFENKTITSTATGWFSEMASDSPLAQAAALRVWDGLGVKATNADSGVPNHATDNNGWYDSILFDFGGDSVELDQVIMGWHRDTDFSLLMYAGEDSPELFGNSYTDLIMTGGWELISNYYCNDCGNFNSGSDIIFDVNVDNKNSSYWLIAALNPAYETQFFDGGNDYFKVKALVGEYVEYTEVSVPGTVMLMLLGFGIYYKVRRVRI